jgi:hypothetical protein
MDEKSQKAEIKALIERNDAAREAIAIHWHKLRHRADIPARLRDSIRSNRTWWFAGSAVFGLLATSLFRKKAPVPAPSRTTRKGLLGLAVTTAFAFAKPALKTWLWNEVQKRITPRSGPRRTSP